MLLNQGLCYFLLYVPDMAADMLFLAKDYAIHLLCVPVTLENLFLASFHVEQTCITYSTMMTRYFQSVLEQICCLSNVQRRHQLGGKCAEETRFFVYTLSQV